MLHFTYWLQKLWFTNLKIPGNFSIPYWNRDCIFPTQIYQEVSATSRHFVIVHLFQQDPASALATCYML